MVEIVDKSGEEKRLRERSELISKIAEGIFPDKQVTDLGLLVVIHDLGTCENDTDEWRVTINPILQIVEVHDRNYYDDSYILTEKCERATKERFQLHNYCEEKSGIDKSGYDGWLT